VAKCPKCGKEIKLLYCVQAEYVYYIFNGRDYEESNKVNDWRATPDFICPECNEVLTNSEEEAREILGMKEVKWRGS